MMMFMMHISALLALGVLLGSTTLVMWARQNKKAEGACLAKKVGYTAFVLSLLSFLCTAYHGIKYWSQGDFETAFPMHRGMHQKAMMEKMMPQMMQNMMGNMMGNMGEKKEETNSQP